MCVATHPYHLDPLRVAEQTSLPSATRKGSCRFSRSLYIGLRHYVARPMPRERASFGCRYYCQSLVYLGKTSDLSDSWAAPRQGCVFHSPGVGGAQPRRPRVSIALFYPLDPDRASLVIESYWRERHPIGVVYIRRTAGDPGSSALRASTAGYAERTPTGVPCRTAFPIICIWCRFTTPDNLHLV